MAVRSGGGGGQDAQYQNITRFLSIGTFYETNIYETFGLILDSKISTLPYLFFIRTKSLKLGAPSTQMNVRSGLTSDSN